MDDHYKSLTGKSFESNILFIGQYNCPPNYFFRGNNVRDNYVIHYIQDGKGTFSSANRPAVTLKKVIYLFYRKESLAFIKQMGKILGNTFGSVFLGLKSRRCLLGLN